MENLKGWTLRLIRPSIVARSGSLAITDFLLEESYLRWSGFEKLFAFLSGCL